MMMRVAHTHDVVGQLPFDQSSFVAHRVGYPVQRSLPESNNSLEFASTLIHEK